MTKVTGWGRCCSKGIASLVYVGVLTAAFVGLSTDVAADFGICCDVEQSDPCPGDMVCMTFGSLGANPCDTSIPSSGFDYCRYPAEPE